MNKYNMKVRLTKIMKLDFSPETVGYSVNGQLREISINGHRGTWYVIGIAEYKNETVFLLEHEKYGERAAALIVNSEGTIILDDVHNGFDDINDIEDGE